MAFVSDSFTDTAGTLLTAHTGATGATWTRHADTATNTVVSDANRVRIDAATAAESEHYASGLPAGVEYDVEGVVVLVSDNDLSAAGVWGRLDTAAGRSGYVAQYNSGLNRWELFKRAASTWTLLGNHSQVLTPGQGYTVKLEIRDATKKLYVDGVERISSTDNVVTAAGRVGTHFYNAASNATGVHLDSITATDLAAPQVAYPDADVSAGSWTTAPLWSKVDDESDADFITSSTTSGDACRLSLAAVSDPDLSTGHVLRIRVTKTATGGSSPSVTFALYEGATLRATSGAVAVADSIAYTEVTYTLTGTEADAITDYSALDIDLLMTRGGGSARGIRVSSAKLEVPAAAPAGATGTVSAGSHAVAGQSVAAQSGALATVAGGTLAVSGQAVSGGVGDLGSVAAGAHAVAGQAVSGTSGAVGALAAGSLAATGQPVAGQAGALGAVASGGHAVSGQAVAADPAVSGAVATGSHAVSGQSVAAQSGAVATVAAGSLAVAGQAVAGTEGGGPETGTVAAGAHAVAGQAVAAAAGAVGTVSTGGGGFVLGESLLGSGTLGDGGGYAVSGQPIAATAGAVGTVAAGGLAVAGQAVLSGSAESATGLVAAGSLAVAGQAVAGGTGTAGAVAGGILAVSGQAVAAHAGTIAAVAAGTLAVGGQAVGGAASAAGAGAAGSLAVAGQAVAARTGSVGAVAAGGLAVSGQAVSGTGSGPTVAGTVAAGSLAVAGQAVSARAGAVGAVESGAHAVAGQDVVGQTGTVAAVETGDLAVAGQPVAGWGLVGQLTTPSGEFGAAPRVVAVLVTSDPVPAGVLAGAGEPRGRFG